MKLGRYEILEELGRGGFGIVYRARDSVLGRYVALKVLHSQLTVDPGFIGRFEQEARLAAQLEHPNLVPVHDLGQEDGRYFIAMGLMAGGSLKDRLKAGPLPEEQVHDVLPQILRGLEVIHENGIIHRDLKPGNILFDQYEIARISDLGFAKALHADSSVSLSMTGGMIGTPAYMAPEVWRGNQASVRSDIYSLGCILYEILTGEVLFEGETPAMAMTKHLVDRPQYKHKLPDGWHDLLDKCIAMDPNDRYQNVSSILEDYLALRSKPEQVSDTLQEEVEKPEVPEKEDVRLGEIDHNDRGQEKNQIITVVEEPQDNSTNSEHTNTEHEVSSEEKKEIASIDRPEIGKSTDVSERNKKSLLRVFIAVAVITALVLIAIQETLSTRNIPTFGISSTKTRSKDKMVLVYVPAGTFTMGSNSYEIERPFRQVFLDSFWIDKYEVSNAQYASCVAAGACTKPSDTNSFTRSKYYGNSSYDNYPVIYVSWQQAQTYCEWAGGSLPTEAQWEKAASGNDSRSYPWGDKYPTCQLANYSGCSGDTHPVTDYPAGVSPYGAFNMAGNVWEWVHDWYGPYDKSQTTNPVGPFSGTKKVLRGGFWDNDEKYTRVASRYSGYPSITNYGFGFRCVMSEP